MTNNEKKFCLPTVPFLPNEMECRSYHRNVGKIRGHTSTVVKTNVVWIHNGLIDFNILRSKDDAWKNLIYNLKAIVIGRHRCQRSKLVAVLFFRNTPTIFFLRN